MAKIIGAIGCSHTPTIGYAQDNQKQDDLAWKAIFDGFAPVQDWLEEKKPDVLFFIYNDHITSFFFDHYSPFALGVGEEYRIADEGGGSRNIPIIKGHAELARHIGKSLMADEFDISFFQNKPLDHGLVSPLSILFPKAESWPCKIIPLQVGVLQSPAPSASRCYKIGQALRKAIESYPEHLRIAIVGTGGLSHQVHGERAGFNNVEWDKEFLELIEKDPEKISKMSHAELATLGGYEGLEVIMWLVMRGALADKVTKLHQSYCLPSMTGIATVILENVSDDAMDQNEVDAHLEKMNAPVRGFENLKGTYPFDLQTSVRTYNLNKCLHDLIEPQNREEFLLEPDVYMNKFGLTEKEMSLIKARDWRGLIQYGAIFFVLEKMAAVLGVSNLHVYAAMRGESFEDFKKTRNSPSAVYSVSSTSI